MQAADLQQIKEIIEDVVEDKVRRVVKEVVKEEVNSRVEESETLIILAIAKSFDEMQRQFDGVQEQFDGIQGQFDGIQGQFDGIKKILDNKANESTVLHWGDEQVVPLKNDVDKLKYLHKDEWKSLPDSGTVSRILVEQGIKS
ncbi:hypothetical protein A2477_00470 [Candidatus Falkowbacteria bacterium RIFOXYC2_FULL_47_12]|uniref:Uncharacterized protein n=2 Tax=Candidatus Falkowiibacteriota TaxID=1752728 RepID=A0A1F5TLV5_9BACT|nr:MAG: hypothetical protein A2242_00180 [Candidatus Falkowbacteria bacterium RIFOXYA2_FULL_47_9]OGF39844.1 MAG: hypothetical protein A2477_00470 [Candidatus Falkowbacteria bacterium RIFOXYC2_FULL_47_12]